MPSNRSRASSVASLNATERAQWLASLSDAEALALRYEWPFWARPAQLEPVGDWFVWLVKPGRGWGKTKCGAETVRSWVESGRYGRIALVNDTAADVRDVMVEGPDGLLACAPPWNRPVYEPSKRRVTWPKTGAQAICYAAEAPGLLRGPQHDAAWCDELAKWKNLQRKDENGDTAWSNLLMGLRMGAQPRCLVTTTPRPIPIITALATDPQTFVTNGRLFDNIANLAPEFVRQMRRRYEGTRLGRQELDGQLLDDVPGALWTRDRIDALRRESAPTCTRIVVAIDPAVSSGEESDETGLIVAGLGVDGHGYVLADRSGTYTPAQWGEQAVQLFDTYQADRILGEVNNGGEMVGHTVQTAAQDLHQRGRRPSRYVPYVAVHASRGKLTRAEPIAALYEQGRAHHVGMYPELEDQMATWMPGLDSPDRMDALVWAFTDLLLNQPVALDVYDTQADAEAVQEQTDADRAAQTERSAAVVADEIARNGAYMPGAFR